MEIVVAAVIIVGLIIAAFYISLQKKGGDEEVSMPSIHASGIYSVIRMSPRANLHPAKPTVETMRRLLDSVERDSNGKSLTAESRAALLLAYEADLEKCVKLVEESDGIGVQRYLIHADGPECRCAHLFGYRYFITREDIYRHPELLPPYYPGCTCRLIPESQWKRAVDLEQ